MGKTRGTRLKSVKEIAALSNEKLIIAHDATIKQPGAVRQGAAEFCSKI